MREEWALGLNVLALIIGIAIGTFAFNYFTNDTYSQGVLDGVKTANCADTALLDYVFESPVPPTLEEFKQVKKTCFEQHLSIEWTDEGYYQVEEQYEVFVQYWR